MALCHLFQQLLRVSDPESSNLGGKTLSKANLQFTPLFFLVSIFLSVLFFFISHASTEQQLANNELAVIYY